MKPTEKKRAQKQKFLKNVGLQPIKIQRYFDIFLFSLNLEVQNNDK